MINSAEDFGSRGIWFQFQRKIPLFGFLLKSSSPGSEMKRGP